MTTIETTRGPMDENDLIGRRDTQEIKTDDYHAVATATEYCVKGCPGIAHKTEVRDTPEFFCSKHVHRSVHVDVLKTPSLTPSIQEMR